MTQMGKAVRHALSERREKFGSARTPKRAGAGLQGIFENSQGGVSIETVMQVQSAALTAAANAIALTNRNGVIVWVNPAFSTLTGYSLAEAAGKNPRDLVKSGRQERAVYQVLWETIQAGKVWRGELVNSRKDGSFYVVDQTITPVLDDKGEVAYFIAISQYLTQRKQAETVLRANERKLQAIFSQAAVGMVITEGATGRFLNVNARFCEMVGLSADALLQFTFKKITHPANLQGEAAVEGIPSGTRATTREMRLQRMDGSDLWARIFTAPLDPTEAEPTQLIGVVEDITARKQVEIELRATEARSLLQRKALTTLTGAEGHKSGGLADTLRLITETAAETLSVARVSIWRCNDDCTTIRCLDLFEGNLHSDGAELHATQYPAYFQALARMDVIAVSDPLRDSRTCELAADYLMPLGITAVLDAAIHMRGAVDGVLCHEHVGPARVWRADEEAFAAATANLISLVLEEHQRQNAEEALRQSEERYRLLFEQATDIIAVLSPTGVMTALNRAFETITGWPISEWLGKSYTELVHLDDRVRADKLFETVLRGESMPPFELRFQAAAGGFRVLELTAIAGRLSDGSIEVQAIGRDITERKVAERRIREQNDILSNSHEGVMIVSLTHELVLWNRGAEEIFGWSQADLGRYPEKLLGVDPCALSKLRAKVESEGFWDGELQAQRKDGRKVIMHCRTTLVRDEAGHPRGRLSFLSDITEKKQLEEQVLHAQRLESLGMLAAGIAHDLNNILSPIVFGAPELRNSLSTAGDLRIIDSFEASASRGAELVKQILGFAHGTSGEFRPTQAKHVARDIIGLIEATFPKSIEVHDEIAPDLWPVLGNATQIHQIFLNLSVNARDAMPRGGTLCITAANRQFAATQGGAACAHPGLWVMLEFADSGTGITPEVLERIWEPFFTTKSAIGGTGLGLSTVRGIVARSAGFIEIDTAVGRGTTFRVFLPAIKSKSTRLISELTPAISQGNGELVLVVDDDTAIRVVVSALLTKYGYRVVSCGDGLEAIVMFHAQAGNVALVVTDVDMPRLGGVALVREVWKERPDTPILAISGTADGHTATSDVPEMKRIAHAFVVKPFQQGEFLLTVHRLLHPTSNP